MKNSIWDSLNICYSTKKAGSLYLLFVLAFALGVVSQTPRLKWTTSKVISLKLKAQQEEKILRIKSIKYKQLKKENKKLKTLLYIKNYKTKPPKIIVNWAYTHSKRYVPINDVREIVAESAKYKTFYMLIAVFAEESGFDRYAKSSKNAQGVGQIMTSVWFKTLSSKGIWSKKIDAYDYRKNIAACNYILNKYYTDKGSWKNALSAYVNGNSKYVTKVLSNFAEMSLLTNGLQPVKEIKNAKLTTVHKENK